MGRHIASKTLPRVCAVNKAAGDRRKLLIVRRKESSGGTTGQTPGVS